MYICFYLMYVLICFLLSGNSVLRLYYFKWNTIILLPFCLQGIGVPEIYVLSASGTILHLGSNNGTSWSSPPAADSFERTASGYWMPFAFIAWAGKHHSCICAGVLLASAMLHFCSELCMRSLPYRGRQVGTFNTDKTKHVSSELKILPFCPFLFST